MRTIGVDLSSSAERTGLASIEWSSRGAVVGEPALGLGDEELVQRLVAGDWIGIDAPFGWPVAMASAAYGYLTEDFWSSPSVDEFRFRRTDRFVRDRIWADRGRRFAPTSVSASRSSLTARRLALLREHAYLSSGFRFDRAGSDRVVEVEVRASLCLWDLPWSSYKGARRAQFREIERQGREKLVSILEATAPWLSWAPGARERCIQSDDALDAVFAALVARAAALELTYPPPSADASAAHTEGWIHLPLGESLSALGDRG